MPSIMYSKSTSSLYGHRKRKLDASTHPSCPTNRAAPYTLEVAGEGRNGIRGARSDPPRCMLGSVMEGCDGIA